MPPSETSETNNSQRPKGKGVFYDSNPLDHKIYKDFLARKNEFLANIIWKIGPKAQDPDFYNKVLDEINSVLGENEDVMDSTTFQKIQKLITDQVEFENSESKAKFEALNRKISDMNDSVLDNLKSHCDEGDKLWKYRCLQLLLLITPFAGIHALSYIGPFMELMGPLFDATTSLGEALGDISSSDVLWIFGDTVEAFRIDDLIELAIDKTPVVEGVFEILNYLIDNDLTQNALGAASSLPFSPIALLMPAVLYSLFRADIETTRYQKILDFEKSQRKDLEEIFKDFKNGEFTGLEERLKDFYGKTMTTFKEANLDEKLVSFVSDPKNANKLADLFDGLQFVIKEGPGDTINCSMLQIYEKDDKKKFSEILNDVNSDAKKEAMNRFLLFSSIEDSAKSDDENLAVFLNTRSEEEKKGLCDKKIEDFNYEYITNSAIKLKLITEERLKEIEQLKIDQGIEETEIRAQISKLLENQIIDFNAKHSLRLAKKEIPNSAVFEPKAPPLATGYSPDDLTKKTPGAASTPKVLSIACSEAVKRRWEERKKVALYCELVDSIYRKGDNDDYLDLLDTYQIKTEDGRNFIQRLQFQYEHPLKRKILSWPLTNDLFEDRAEGIEIFLDSENSVATTKIMDRFLLFEGICIEDSNSPDLKKLLETEKDDIKANELRNKAREFYDYKSITSFAIEEGLINKTDLETMEISQRKKDISQLLENRISGGTKTPSSTVVNAKAMALAGVRNNRGFLPCSVHDPSRVR
jgi:hypothetical protein